MVRHPVTVKENNIVPAVIKILIYKHRHPVTLNKDLPEVTWKEVQDSSGDLQMVRYINIQLYTCTGFQLILLG